MLFGMSMREFVRHTHTHTMSLCSEITNIWGGGLLIACEEEKYMFWS